MTPLTPGEWLRGELAQREITPAKLARQLEVSETLVYGWIRGRGKPGDDNTRKIAQALDLTEAVVRARLGMYVSPELIELARRQLRVDGLQQAARRKHERQVLDDLAELGQALDEAEPTRHE